MYHIKTKLTILLKCHYILVAFKIFNLYFYEINFK